MSIAIDISIPTRGDVDMQPILISLCQALPDINRGILLKKAIQDAYIYDNSKLIDFQVFSRYVHASTVNQGADYIYTQDDDCTIDIASFIHDPQVVSAMNNNQIICNMPKEHYANYKDTPEKLVGFGCLFPYSSIAPTFNTYLKHFPIDTLLFREADRIFTGLNTIGTLITHHPVHHLPHASSPTRMYRQPGHENFRHLARARVLQILNPPNPT